MLKRHFSSHGVFFFLLKTVSAGPSGGQKLAAFDLGNFARSTRGTVQFVGCNLVVACCEMRCTSFLALPLHLLQKHYMKGLAGGLRP